MLPDLSPPSTAQPLPVSVSQVFAQTEARRKAKAPWTPLNDSIATACVAISILCMAFSGLVTAVLVVIFLLIWLSVPLFKGILTLKPAPDMLWIMAFPALCCLSIFWSDSPKKTIYLGLAFTAMMLCVLLMNRVVTFKALMQGMSLGLTITLLLTIQKNTYAMDGMTGTYALVGYFGSKNVVGFLSQIAIITALFGVFLHRTLVRRLIYCLPLLLAGAYCLYASKSASSLLSCVFALSFVSGLYWVALLPKKLRALCLVLFIASGITVVAMVLSLGFQKEILQSVGKDSTLTGRTYLWSEGQKIGWQKPVLGHGYHAFWVPGQPKAERYWHEFGINPTPGFHFHSMHIQTFVDLGIGGVILVATLYVMTLFLSARALFSGNHRVEAGWMLCISVVFIVRSFVEVDIIGPFGVSVLIFYSLVARLKYRPQLTNLSSPT